MRGMKKVGVLTQPRVRVSFHHLTSEGWVESDVRPSDAIETWVRHSDGPTKGKPSIAYTRDWVHPAWSHRDVAELRDQFLRPEARVSGVSADIKWEIIDY